MITAGKHVRIHAHAPPGADLTLRCEAGKEVSLIAGLWNLEHRQLRASSVRWKARTLELNPADRPTHGRVCVMRIIGSDRKCACGKAVRFDLISHPQKCPTQFVAQCSTRTFSPEVHSGGAERTRLHSGDHFGFVLHRLRNNIYHSAHRLRSVV